MPLIYKQRKIMGVATLYYKLTRGSLGTSGCFCTQLMAVPFLCQGLTMYLHISIVSRQSRRVVKLDELTDTWLWVSI